MQFLGFLLLHQEAFLVDQAEKGLTIVHTLDSRRKSHHAALASRLRLLVNLTFENDFSEIDQRDGSLSQATCNVRLLCNRIYWSFLGFEDWC